MRFLRSPVFYLISSNLVFWGVPLLLVHLKTHVVLEEPGSVPAAMDLAMAVPQDRQPESADSLLVELPPPHVPEVSIAAEPSVPEPLPVARTVAVQALLPLPEEPPLNLMKDLKGAAGLGGPITLKSLKEPLMPIAARAERLQQRQSGDSLAALPRHWRDSVREELPASASVSTAAVVRLPVPALKQRQEVPVIVNERGEGEALVSPEDPRVRRAVEGWAARQHASGPGTVQVYVIAAEPLTLPAD